MTVTAFVFAIGAISMIFVSALLTNTAVAYTVGEDCGKYSTPGEEEACQQEQKLKTDCATTPSGDMDAELKEKCNEAGLKSQECAPGEKGCCNGVKTSIIGGDLCGTDESQTETSTIYRLLIGVLNILTAGVGIAAVGGVAYGALLYTTAENKPEQTKKAIGVITNVVIGLVAYAFMYILLNFLIPGGILK